MQTSERWGEGRAPPLSLSRTSCIPRLPSLSLSLSTPAAGPSTPTPSTGTSTPLQAVVNTVQVFMGIGLLSMPYAMRLGGWVGGCGGLALALAAFRVSAGLLDAGLAALPPGTPKTFAALGAAALGPAARSVVGALAVAEFGGGAALTLAIVFKQAALLLPAAAAAPPAHLAGWVVGALLPLLAVPSFRRLTPLSAVGCVATAAVAVAVGACVIADPAHAHYGGTTPGAPPPGHGLLRPGVARALGIFAVSVSGHSSLPALRSSLADPAAFPAVLNAAFLAMAAAYGATAMAGYFYFGDAASPVVTSNLAADAPFAGAPLLPPPFPPSLTADALVGWAVLANAFSTYPSMVMVVQTTLWSLTPWARGAGTSAGGGDGVNGWLCRPGVGLDPGEVALRRPRRAVRFGLRVAIAAATAGAALVAASSLGSAIALLGGLAALACSLILPTVCYWRVVLPAQAGGGSPWRRAGLVGLVAGGVVLMVLIVVQTAAGGGGGR